MILNSGLKTETISRGNFPFDGSERLQRDTEPSEGFHNGTFRKFPLMTTSRSFGVRLMGLENLGFIVSQAFQKIREKP